jgi:hypothetical protein
MNTLSTRLYKALNNPVFTQSKPSYSHHPSGASIEVVDKQGKRIIGECNRKLYYQSEKLGATDYGETEWDLSAKMGDKFHELAVDLIHNYGYRMGLQLIAKEQPYFDPVHNVSGRIDMIAYDLENKEPVGIEVKSVGEWKAKAVTEQPADEHILQAMLYLDWYDRYTSDSSQKITKWYIWYLARSESWALKGKEHGSPFTQMWDFYVTLDEGSPIVHSAKGSIKLDKFNVAGIYARQKALDEAKANRQLPDRDYELQYSEEKLATLYRLDLLEYKKDKEPIEKWLKKGAKPGTLKVEMGDFNCKMCPYKSLCWNITNISNVTEPDHYVKFNKVAKDNKPDTLFI